VSADVGIIIPTHNRRELLEHTVQTALVQRDVEVEVVVVDDASTDDTWDWLQSLGDPRVIPLRQDPGRGGSAARNLGLAELRSGLVMFLDDDDLLRPTACRALVHALRRHPDAIGSGGTHAKFGAVEPYRQPHVRVPLMASIWREEVFGWNLQPGSSVWRTPWARDVGGWSESLPRCEDLDFNFKSYPHRLALVPDTVVDFRYRPPETDPERIALQARLDVEVREQFIARLPDRERRVGDGLMKARDEFAPALAAYNDGRFPAAVAGLTRTLRAAPFLVRSPIVGPWLLGLVAKATAGSLMPSPIRDATRRYRDTRGRGLRESTSRDS
jgi:glycosyltransferase involved in cell wall biosynthesis